MDQKPPQHLAEERERRRPSGEYRSEADLRDALGNRIPHGPEEVEMIVMFSARRLKPDAWEPFRRAWDPGDSMPPGFKSAYHARNIRDEDEVISFGLFDMTEDEYRAWRESADAEENQRVDRMTTFVKNEYVSGVFEVIDVVEP